MTLPLLGRMSLSGFAHSWFFLFLLVVFGLAALYILMQLARQRRMLRFANMELLESVAPQRPPKWRHLPAILLIASLVLFTIAMAGPTNDVRIPRNRAVIMLVIDMSQSMRATDVEPNRLKAAEQAASQFAIQLTPGVNLGLVGFAGTPYLLVPPTPQHQATLEALKKLDFADSTATGEAIFTALHAIGATAIAGGDNPPPARIVLLSDGYRTAGRPIEDAASAASNANVPVSTIAFGTDNGVVQIQGQSQRVPVDRASLQKLADTTKGHYYAAASLSQLKQVYQDMGSSIGYKTVPREITQWYVGIAMLFAFAAAGMSLLWTSRLP